MELITTTQDLAEACDRLARHPYITVDTEFLRETTYYPLLCVAQVASADEAVVVDALAEGLDLKPFYQLMANEGVLKVFHAARQDIEIVWHEAGLIPHPIFDTQVAAMVLGYGDSISYDQLVHRITGDTLDKSHRFTDWSKRPRRVGRRGDGGAHLARHLPGRARARLAAAQDAGAQAEGARGADGGRGLARARGADPRRAARPRAQGRRGGRDRPAGADHGRAARGLALAAARVRALEMGPGHPAGGGARARARPEE